MHRPKTTWKLEILKILDRKFQLGDCISISDLYKFTHKINEKLPRKNPRKALYATILSLISDQYFALISKGKYKIIMRPIPQGTEIKMSKFAQKVYQLLKAEEGKIKSFHLEKTFSAMRDRASLRIDFYLSLNSTNFLGYRHIWIEANGTQHREPIRKFRGWKGFINLNKKFNIKVQTLLNRNEFLIICEEGESRDHWRKSIKFAFRNKFSGNVTKFAREAGYLYYSKEFIDPWKTEIPTFSTYRSQNFSVSTKILLVHLQELVLTTWFPDSGFHKYRKIMYASRIRRIEKLQKLHREGYTIIIVDRIITKFTAIVNLHKYGIQKWAQQLPFPTGILVAWGESEGLKRNLFSEELRKMYPKMKNIEYILGSEPEDWDSTAPCKFWCTSNNIKIIHPRMVMYK